MKDIPISQRRVQNGKVKATQLPKVPKPTTPLTLNFQSENCLLPCRMSFSTTYTTAHRRKEKEQSTQARDKITFVQK